MSVDISFVVKRALEVQRDLQLIRYKIARKLAQKLAQLESSPIITEINSYPAYIWVPKDKAREYRVWPPTLTSLQGGWLQDKGMVSMPPMTVSWNEVFDKLIPAFRYKSIILQSIKGMLSEFTNIELETHFIESEGYDGTVNYGDYKGWYKITHEGIKIDYVMPVEDTTGSTYDYTVTVKLTTTSCPIRQRLKEMLYTVSEGFIIECPDGSVKKVQYSATDCPALDQVVTLLRQILDQQIYCPTDFPSRVVFLDGPLAGLNWSAMDRNNFITWDGERATTYDLTSIESMFKTAMDTCRTSMTKLACQLAGDACPQGTTCMDSYNCVEKLGGTCQGQCPNMPERYCCCKTS
jgi:hypothetical protein